MRYIQRTIGLLFIATTLGMTTASPARGQDLSGMPGAFADIGLGMRPLGMGGAYTALAADENAARWNPALLSEVLYPTAGFTWTKQFNLISYNYLATAIPVGTTMGVGAYLISAGDDAYRETTIGLSAGAPGEMFKLPEQFSVGSTFKIYNSGFGNNADGGDDRVDGSAWGFGLDLAASIRLSDEFNFAIVGHDLISYIGWNSSVKGSYSEGTPAKIALAGAFHDDQIAISFDVQPGLYADVPMRVAMGAELTIFGALKPRIGLAQNFGDSDPNRWVTIGMGMDLHPEFLGPIRDIRFGYTHLIHDIDSTPRVGLTLSW